MPVSYLKSFFKFDQRFRMEIAKNNMSNISIKKNSYLYTANKKMCLSKADSFTGMTFSEHPPGSLSIYYVFICMYPVCTRRIRKLTTNSRSLRRGIESKPHKNWLVHNRNKKHLIVNTIHTNKNTGGPQISSKTSPA